MTLLLLCSSIHAAIIGDLQWQASHGTSGPDYAYAMTADDSGNVYVTGFTSLDMGSLTTIKYGSDGNEVWTTHRMFFAPVSLGFNESGGLMVDGLGNVCVSVPTWHAIIKYDTNGDELWMSWYDDPEVGNDVVGRAMAIDNQQNIYVTGEGYYDDTDYDYATIAFNPDGDTLWRARYNSSGENSDYAAAVAVDEMQNVYVTGSSGTIKYDPNGTEVWIKPDGGQDLAIDVTGNVHLTEHGTTTVYSPQGTVIWHLPHTDPPHEIISSCLEVDSMSSTLVLDSMDKGSNMDFVTTKLDTDGNFLWSDSYTICGLSAGRSNSQLALDDAGNVYIYCFNDREYWWNKAQALIKYDLDGNMVWSMHPGNTDPDWMDVFSSITVDDAGNVYLAGSTFDWNYNRVWDYKTIKYTQREANIYTISTSAGPNGTIDPNGSTPIQELQTIQLTAAPDPNYMIDTWYVDGEPTDTFGPVCTLYDVISDHTMHITFKPQPALVEINAHLEPCELFESCDLGDGGNIFQGDSKHYFATIALLFSVDGKNYGIDKWYLDGVEVKTGGLSYYLHDIQTNHELVATVKEVPIEYDLTCSAGPNGSVTKWLYADLFIAEPNEDYVVDKWYIDGTVVQKGAIHYTPYDNQDHHIHVTFKKPSLNLADFANIAAHWNTTECWSIDWSAFPSICDCYNSDLNLDRSVNFQDLMLFTKYWLQPVTPHGIQTLVRYNRDIESVRIAIDLYKMQHNNQLPGAGGAGFEMALVTCTDIGGNQVPCDSSGTYGPYLEVMPQNPFSSLHGSSIRMDGPPAGADMTHWRFDTTTGFFEADDAADHDLPVVENWHMRMEIFIQEIRDAIELYKREHCDILPTLGNASFEECLTGITDEVGDVWIEGASGGTKFGPYLRKIPTNPFNGLNTVEVDGNAGDNTHGWCFYSTWGRFLFDDPYTDIFGTMHTTY
jgi:hypothetical protein